MTVVEWGQLKPSTEAALSKVVDPLSESLPTLHSSHVVYSNQFFPISATTTLFVSSPVKERIVELEAGVNVQGSELKFESVIMLNDGVVLADGPHAELPSETLKGAQIKWAQGMLEEYFSFLRHNLALIRFNLGQPEKA